MTKLEKTKAKLERAKLAVAASREQAAGMAQQYAIWPLPKRPSALQRRRLARLSAFKS
jgi:hypothetical protein